MKLCVLNEEFLVNVVDQTALITSLPFVHTARRSYRLNEKVKRREREVVILRKNVFEPFHLEEGEVVTRFS